MDLDDESRRGCNVTLKLPPRIVIPDWKPARMVAIDLKKVT